MRSSDESSLHDEGWKVALASGVGVFVTWTFQAIAGLPFDRWTAPRRL